MRPLDLAGKSFGRLTALFPEGHDSGGRVLWLCRCVCGTRKLVRSSLLPTGRVQSCGCLRLERLQNANRLRPFESLYNSFLHSSERRENVPVQLAYEDFVTFTAKTECSYCGDRIEWTQFDTGKNGMAYNLDRVDNTQGYSPSNCVVCCGTCNRMKSSLSAQTFISRVHQISEHMRSRCTKQC